MEYYLDVVRQLGFTHVRIPFAKQYVDEGEFSQMDRLMQGCLERNLSVVLDYHRTFNSHQGADIYEGGTTLEQFIQTWFIMLDRYKDNPALVAGNAFNEPTGSDPQPILFWTSALFDAVEARYGDRFWHGATGHSWAGNLRGMSMEDKPYAQRIMYSIHVYSWSGDSNEQSWESSFGSLFPPDKIIIGEFGAFLPKDDSWIDSFTQYLRKKKIHHWMFWNLLFSDDTTNLFKDKGPTACLEINWDIYNKLGPIWE
jgi:hypothetical protein